MRRVAIIGFEGLQPLDLVGPLEVFAKANERKNRQDAGYEILLASPAGGTIRSSSGLELSGLHALDELPDELDTILVAGGGERGLRAAVLETGLIAWLHARLPGTRRIASVCTGAFVLGAAGLLDGRRATTHWASCDLLQQMWPQIRVDADAIFVADPPIYTSAGITTGIDLCLALVEEDCGAATALAVARDLVLFMRRPGGQAQFSTTLQAQTASTPAIARLIAEIADDPSGDLSITALAARAHMSERSFVRKFREETGTTPARFVQQPRIDRAKALLESSTAPLARIAQRAGFNSQDSLQRAFAERVGVTPAAYRERFGIGRSAGN